MSTLADTLSKLECFVKITQSLATLACIWHIDRAVSESSRLRTYFVIITLSSLLGWSLLALWAVSTHKCLLTAADPYQCIESCVADRSTQTLAAMALRTGETKQSMVCAWHEKQGECELNLGKSIADLLQEGFQAIHG